MKVELGRETFKPARLAWQKAIGTAIAIAGDQVSHGNPFFGAEVTLEEGNRRIGRYVVAVGATPLNNQPSDD
jgi:hypothetical protein